MSTGYRRTCLSISYHMPCSGGDCVTWSFVLLPMPSLSCFPRLLLSPLPPSSDLSFSSGPLLFLSMYSFSLLWITFLWPLFSLPRIAYFFFLSLCPLCASLRQGPPCLQAGGGLPAGGSPRHTAQGRELEQPRSAHRTAAVAGQSAFHAQKPTAKLWQDPTVCLRTDLFF